MERGSSVLDVDPALAAAVDEVYKGTPASIGTTATSKQIELHYPRTGVTPEVAQKLPVGRPSEQAAPPPIYPAIRAADKKQEEGDNKDNGKTDNTGDTEALPRRNPGDRGNGGGRRST